MQEVLIADNKIWVIFDDKSLMHKPICKVKTLNNQEEYNMGIHLLKIHKFALEESKLIDKIEDLPVFYLHEFIKKYAPN
ncbi:MAG: hypothetical protein NC131_10570 [Roseburia sp.]|nr:hypothetical protein [Roseburia sp.]